MSKIKIRENFILEGKHGKPITADIYQPDAPGIFPVVIFSHGFKGFKNWGPFSHIANLFAKDGFTFVKINFAFNGTTPETPNHFTDLDAFGQNNFSKELDDLEVTIDWIEKNATTMNVDANRIYLIGHSRGGGISLIKAFEDSRVKKVAAWASVAGFNRHISRQDIRNWKNTGVHYVENARTKQMMPLFIQLYHDFIKNHRRFNISKIASNINKPILFTHAVDDDTIPIAQIVEFQEFNPLNIKLLQINSGGHTFDAVHPFELSELPNAFQLVVNETLDFFKVK
jgi:uncharacterized protein